MSPRRVLNSVSFLLGLQILRTDTRDQGLSRGTPRKIFLTVLGDRLPYCGLGLLLFGYNKIILL